MKIDVVRFEMSHLDHAIGERDLISPHKNKDIVAEESLGMGFSCFADDKLVFCAGISPLWSGVGQGWAMSFDATDDYKTVVGRRLIRGFDSVVAACNYHRVQAQVHKDFNLGRRMLQWLGFEQECVLKKFGEDGSDWVQCVRFYDGC